MKKGQLRQLVLSLGAGIAVFLVLALALRWSFLFSAALGVGIYLGLWFLLTPKADPVALYFAKRPDGGEMQALMEEAARDLRAIRSAAGRITDVRTHEDALALTETGGSPLPVSPGASGEDPVGQPLPHLLPGHGGPDLGAVCEVPGGRAGDFRGAGVPAEGAGHPAKLKTGFEAQLSQLMASERFDAEADMKVMEGLLNTEGFQWEANQNGSV